MALRCIEYKNQQFHIAYKIYNPHAEQTIVFLHGWGASKELMERAFEPHFKEFCTLFIDLPGFGNSSNTLPLTTHDYKEIIKIFLDSLHLTKHYILVGHSFGGKVAALLAPKCLVLIASAGMIYKKSLSIRWKILLAKVLRTFGLKSTYLRAKDAHNLNEAMYETFKNVVNEDFRPVFKNLQSKTLLLWGKDDHATPIRCAHDIKSLIIHSKLILFEGDHYFFLQSSFHVAQHIKEYFDI